MARVMAILHYPIPKFILTRYCTIALHRKPESPATAVVKGIDELGAPYSCFTQVTLIDGKNRVIVKREPFVVPVPPGLPAFDLVIYCYGHYKEPGCKIRIDVGTHGMAKHSKLEFDPSNSKREWIVTPHNPL